MEKEKKQEEKKQEGNAGNAKEMSFWEHLDELRGTIFRSAAGIVICMTAVFLNKYLLFDVIILGPTDSEFPLYSLFNSLSYAWDMPSLQIEPFSLSFQNVTVSGQFFTHISTSFWFGLVLSFPWIIYQIWLFVRPALYENERKAATGAFGFSSLLFFLGIAVGYFLALPLAVKFLGTYQVSDRVDNVIALTSYIDLFVVLEISMGLLFQLPILVFMLGRIGILRRWMLRKYRRHAIVVIMTVVAVVSPTVDPVSMLALSLPIWLLYEASVYLCPK
ncbi:MAG: twin-arginine translocase subunit TatC [Prevotellaceae bacterium]|jgi:sec-independent protein translocase protein TatC|nr:twin-arginine translocase subunit TatC [Prevotellaceae bacterium]